MILQRFGKSLGKSYIHCVQAGALHRAPDRRLHQDHREGLRREQGNMFNDSYMYYIYRILYR